MTPLDKTLKRAIKIRKEDFVVTLTPEHLKVTRKGHQRGLEIRWESLVSGESALAVALQASVGQFERGKATDLQARPITSISRTSVKKSGAARGRRAKTPRA
jgi:hypothetical protein